MLSNFNLNFCVVLLLLLIAFNTNSSEEKTRFELENVVKELYHAKQHEDLIKLSSQLLTHKTRTASGVWQHSLVYFAMTNILDATNTSEDYWQNTLANTRSLAHQFPNSPFYYLVHANAIWLQGRMYRMTKEPSDKNYYKSNYNQKLAEAKLYLDSNKTIASNDPRYYELMLYIASDQKWQFIEFQTLFQEAISLYPDYHQIYFAAVQYHYNNAVDPQKAVEILAIDAMKSKETTESKAMYARIHWYELKRCNCNVPLNKSLLYMQSNLNWETMMSSINYLLSDYPDQWNINNMAYFSCLSGDATSSKELLGQIIDPPSDSVWMDLNFYNACQSWVKTNEEFFELN